MWIKGKIKKDLLETTWRGLKSYLKELKLEKLNLKKETLQDETEFKSKDKKSENEKRRIGSSISNITNKESG